MNDEMVIMKQHQKSKKFTRVFEKFDKIIEIIFSDVTTISNQTEIIYSVFVDGIPVLATTAADDMKLVSEDEVAKVMDKMVYTKAERKHLCSYCILDIT